MTPAEAAMENLCVDCGEVCGEPSTRCDRCSAEWQERVRIAAGEAMDLVES